MVCHTFPLSKGCATVPMCQSARPVGMYRTHRLSQEPGPSSGETRWVLPMSGGLCQEVTGPPLSASEWGAFGRASDERVAIYQTVWGGRPSGGQVAVIQRRPEPPAPPHQILATPQERGPGGWPQEIWVRVPHPNLAETVSGSIWVREIPEIRPRWPPAGRGGFSHLANAAASQGQSPVQSVLCVAEDILVDSYVHLEPQDRVEANMAFAIVALRQLPHQFRSNTEEEAYTNLLRLLERLTLNRVPT